MQVFNDLADAAARPAAAGTAPLEPHLPLAYSYAREVYPELLADAVNHMPRWLTFLVLRRQGRIDGVLGFVERNGVMTTPLIGYDRSVEAGDFLGDV